MPATTTSLFRNCIVALGIATAAAPASAQWTRVDDLPASDVFCVRSNGDTLVACGRTLAYVSTDAGAHWQPSASPNVGVPLLAVLMHNGRLYAGTASKGVLVSDDLGQSWQSFNEGLVGGFFDSQLHTSDLAVRGDSVYVSTFGAGVYVRRISVAGTWSHFGDEFEANQSSNVLALAVGGSRLLAMAGGNGSVFFRDPGDPDWTQSWLDNVGLRPGLQASGAVVSATRWIVGAESGRGVFVSALGEEPWTPVNFNLGPAIEMALAARGHQVFLALDFTTVAVIEYSGDDGASWQPLEVLPDVFVYRMATTGTELFAGRADGLWRRSAPNLSVPDHGDRTGLRFALGGAQPVSNQVRFRFDLPGAAATAIELFDVAGRRAATVLREALPAGAHDISWSARELAPGVYQARLTAGNREEALRLVRVQ